MQWSAQALRFVLFSPNDDRNDDDDDQHFDKTQLNCRAIQMTMFYIERGTCAKDNCNGSLTNFQGLTTILR